MNTLYQPRRIRGLIAAAVIGALASTFAAAAMSDSGAAPTITVKYADLNLAEPQDAAVLYNRIQTAAHTVCSPLEGRDLESSVRRNACVHKAIADAVQAVNRPTLFAVYGAKHPAATPSTLVSMRMH